MFGHTNGNQNWLLGIVDNSNHDDFRIDFAATRDTDSIKAFISKHVKKGNNICTDGWSGYNYLDQFNSGYHRFRHNHGGGDFGFGLESTSHIESIWANLKHSIMKTYNIIPSINSIKFYF